MKMLIILSNHLNISEFKTAASLSIDGSNEQLIVLAITFILLIFILINFVIIPERKKKKEHNILMSNLKIGNRVKLKSGIIGEILMIYDKSVILLTGRYGQEIEVEKESIMEMLDSSTELK